MRNWREAGHKPMWRSALRAPMSLAAKAEGKGRRKGYFLHNHGKSLGGKGTVVRQRTLDQSLAVLEEREFSYNSSDFLSFLSEARPDPAPYLHPIPLSPKRPKGPYFRPKKPLTNSLSHIDDLISHIKSNSKLQTMETQAVLRDFESMRSHLRLPSSRFTRKRTELPPLQGTGYSGLLEVAEWE